jgi:hypothetical protein
MAVMDDLERQTRGEIQRLGNNEGLDAIIDSLHVEGLKAE